MERKLDGEIAVHSVQSNKQTATTDTTPNFSERQASAGSMALVREIEDKVPWMSDFKSLEVHSTSEIKGSSEADVKFDSKIRANQILNRLFTNRESTNI